MVRRTGHDIYNAAMTATPADPGAIDLDDTELEPSDVERGEWQAGTRDYVERLEVVVEALRERVAELKLFTGYLRTSRDHAESKLEAAEARVVELAGALENFDNNFRVEIPEKGLTAGKMTLWFLFDGEPGYGLMIAENSYDEAALNLLWGALNEARAALSATPAEAMERAKAVEAVASTALSLSGAMVDAEGKDCDFSPVDEKWSALTAALAKLDALKP